MKETFCYECGEPMVITDDGIAHHTTVDGTVDFDADASHVALDEEEYQ